jgi:hypothetical protein
MDTKPKNIDLVYYDTRGGGPRQAYRVRLKVPVAMYRLQLRQKSKHM